MFSELVTFPKHNWKTEWIFSTIDHISEVDLSNNGVVTCSHKVISAACLQNVMKEYVLALCLLLSRSVRFISLLQAFHFFPSNTWRININTSNTSIQQHLPVPSRPELAKITYGAKVFYLFGYPDAQDARAQKTVLL